MTIDMISESARKICRKYDETDPYRLAKAMKIIIRFVPMGFYRGCCKGFFMVHRRMKHITINSDLPEELQRIVLAHEIGHAVLHPKDAAIAAFHEITMFDDTDIKEYEANIFAAEMLLKDEDVLETLNGDLFFFQAAQALYVPAELLDFKFRVMKRKGYKLNAPFVANGNFLKNIGQDEFH